MKFEDEEAVEVDGPIAVVEGRRRNLAGLRVYPHPQHAQSVSLQRGKRIKMRKLTLMGETTPFSATIPPFLLLTELGTIDAGFLPFPFWVTEEGG